MNSREAKAARAPEDYIEWEPPRVQRPLLNWSALLENAAIASAGYGLTGLCLPSNALQALGSSYNNITASQVYGRFYQPHYKREAEWGNFLSMFSVNAIFLSLVHLYEVDPLIAMGATLILAASLFVLAKTTPQETSLPTPHRSG